MKKNEIRINDNTFKQRTRCILNGFERNEFLIIHFIPFQVNNETKHMNNQNALS